MSDPTISRAKERQVAERMKALGIRDEDLVEKFVLGSGKGGQKVNKTASCVYLRHEPSHIEVKCQRARSRAVNRVLARRELCDRLEEQVRGEKSRRRQEIEKIRRQKRRRSRRAKQRMLEEKKKQSEKKQRRGPVEAG
ncbi:MAG: peptide chain release factor-like protein [Lentisphaerae bacterium]|nr:peptide chain release factor-like protein [Lentisphaerota bacterium]